MPKKLFLVDGSNHAFRVQYALPPSHASDGFPTRVLYGFTLLFQKMMRTYRPDYCVVSFDVGKTFRHDVFEEYKGTRTDMPADMKRQWPVLPDLVRAFGYTCLIVDNYEADDVLGTLAARFASSDVHAYLVTSDKDFAQLVTPNVSIIDDRKDEIIAYEGVEKKWGVRPEQVIDMLGLSGDTSDNIPGVPGIGVKTAAKLLDQWGTLEAVLEAAAAGKIKGKRGQNLIEHADNARVSARLATIALDVPLEVTLEDLAPQDIHADDLREMFDRWEFGMVARKLLPKQVNVSVDVYRAVTTEDELAEVFSAIREAGEVAVHLEIASSERFRTRIRGASLAWSPEDAVYVALEDRPGIAYDLDEARSELVGILADPDVGKIAENSKQLLEILTDNDAVLRGVAGDVRLLDYTLVPHRRTHGLDQLAQMHLGHNLSYQDAQSQLKLEDVARFAVEPAHLSLLVHRKLAKRLDPGPERVYREIELPLVPVLARMERHGIRIDLEKLAEVRRDIKARVQTAEERCHELAGHTFKVGSTQEVSKVLFEELGLPPSKKTKTGYSTDSSVLEKLSDDHDLPGAILEWRALSKLFNTYLKKLPGYVARDGRIHTHFNQAVAATGRLSSADPNLQNIPIRTFEGRRIRDAFVPAENHLFVSADYSQVELRVLAHFCGARALTEAFTSGQDIHRRTASEVFDVPYDEVTSSQRTAAKAINFGLLYGMSAFRLGRDLAIGRDEAQKYMDEYFGRMPEVQEWIEETKKACREEGYVETLYGRRRLIPEIYSKNYADRMAGEREAVNTRVQGTAADIIKIAMIRVDRALREQGLGSKLLLQVHDELLLEVPHAEVLTVQGLVREAMEGAADLLVPLHVNVAVGHNWNEAHG